MSLWYIHCKQCTYLASRLALLQKDQNEVPLVPRHVLVPSDAFKTITEPIVHLVQTMHLSCTNTNTVSKWTETRFAMTHVTYKFHRVRPKQFLSLWYVQRKLCTYVASRLALPPNGPKQASTSASSPRSTIGYIQNNF
jgi:hypothetical protein